VRYGRRLWRGVPAIRVTPRRLFETREMAGGAAAMAGAAATPRLRIPRRANPYAAGGGSGYGSPYGSSGYGSPYGNAGGRRRIPCAGYSTPYAAPMGAGRSSTATAGTTAGGTGHNPLQERRTNRNLPQPHRVSWRKYTGPRIIRIHSITRSSCRVRPSNGSRSGDWSRTGHFRLAVLSTPNL